MLSTAANDIAPNSRARLHPSPIVLARRLRDAGNFTTREVRLMRASILRLEPPLKDANRY